jgi:hypothetical protein
MSAVDELWKRLLQEGSVVLRASNRAKPIVGALRKKASRYGYDVSVAYDSVSKLYVVILNPQVLEFPNIKLPKISFF